MPLLASEASRAGSCTNLSVTGATLFLMEATDSDDRQLQHDDHQAAEPSVAAAPPRPPVDEASWDLLRYLAATSSLSPVGRDEMIRVFNELESILGRAWPRRQAAGGQGFAQLIRFMGPVSELPKVLMFFTRLHSAIAEPTFAPVLGQLKKQLDWHTWQHIQLQLEVGRLAHAAGWQATYEPAIPGSARKGDVLLVAPDARELLVETTALGQSDPARQASAFDNAVRDGMRRIEHRFAVHVAVDVTEQLGETATEQWLAEMAAVAAQVQIDGGIQTFEGPGGVVHIQQEPFTDGRSTYTGPLLVQDLGRRLVRMVKDKANQSEGDRPAWLRADGQDGLFTFSPWARMPDEERLAQLAALLGPVMKAFKHLAGVVYSSGTMFGMTGPATDSSTVDTTVRTPHGVLIRRLIAPFVVRETLVLPTHGDVMDPWVRGYEDEPRWLDSDLVACGLSPLGQMRP